MRALELATEARANVARAIAFLERPTLEALDRSTAELTAAVTRVQEIQMQPTGSGLKSMLSALRADLRGASLLLRRGWEFQAGLAGQPPYTRAGELAPQSAAASRWTLEG